MTKHEAPSLKSSMGVYTQEHSSFEGAEVFERRDLYSVLEDRRLNYRIEVVVGGPLYYGEQAQQGISYMVTIRTRGKRLETPTWSARLPRLTLPS